MISQLSSCHFAPTALSSQHFTLSHSGMTSFFWEAVSSPSPEEPNSWGTRCWQKLKFQFSSAVDLSVRLQHYELEAVMEALESDYFATYRHQLEQVLPNCDLSALLKNVCEKSVEQKEDLIWRRLLGVVALSDLESLQGITDVETLAEQVALSTPPPIPINSDHERLDHRLSTFFHEVMDFFLTALYFFRADRPISGAYEALTRLQVWIWFPLFLFTSLVPLFDQWLVALSVTALLLVSMWLFLLAYEAWWRPCPDSLEFCENLTEAARRGRLEPVLGREAEIQELINCLVAGQHPILVGPSRVGKSEIVKGLAQLIAQGNVPEELKGKKLFLVKTAELSPQANRWSSEERLQRFVRQLGDPENVILFFDEISAAQGGDNNLLCEQLKLLFDPRNENSLPHIISAVTTENYSSLDPDLKSRCQKVEVESTKETEQILRHFVARRFWEITVTGEAIEKAAADKEGECQPHFGRELLERAIAEVKTQSEKCQNLSKLRQELQFLQLGVQEQLDAPEGMLSVEAIREKNEEIAELNQELLEEKEKMEQMRALKAKKRELSLWRSVLATEIHAGNEECPLVKKQLLLLHHHLLPAYNQQIDSIELPSVEEENIQKLIDSPDVM